MKFFNHLAIGVAGAALFAANPVLAETQAETNVEAKGVDAPIANGDEGPALWKVADEDTTIYLFGTVHVLPSELAWYDEEIAAALNSADTVVTEIAMDPQSEQAMQQMAIQRGMFTDGTTLRSLLDDEQKAEYESALTGLGLPAAQLDQLEPWMVGLTLTMLPLLQQGYDVNSGADNVILARAGETEKDALETAEFQLGIFDNLPQDKQVEFLMSAVENIDNTKEMLDAMVAAWADGDADGLAEIMNASMEDPDLAKALLYDRNANWAEWIDTRLETPGTVFIAVGAGHLAGELSVQDYLAERDIATTRIQ